MIENPTILFDAGNPYVKNTLRYFNDGADVDAHYFDGLFRLYHEGKITKENFLRKTSHIREELSQLTENKNRLLCHSLRSSAIWEVVIGSLMLYLGYDGMVINAYIGQKRLGCPDRKIQLAIIESGLSDFGLEEITHVDFQWESQNIFGKARYKTLAIVPSDVNFEEWLMLMKMTDTLVDFDLISCQTVDEIDEELAFIHYALTGEERLQKH